MGTRAFAAPESFFPLRHFLSIICTRRGPSIVAQATRREGAAGPAGLWAIMSGTFVSPWRRSLVPGPPAVCITGVISGNRFTGLANGWFNLLIDHRARVHQWRAISSGRLGPGWSDRLMDADGVHKRTGTPAVALSTTTAFRPPRSSPIFPATCDFATATLLAISTCVRAATTCRAYGLYQLFQPGAYRMAPGRRLHFPAGAAAADLHHHRLRRSPTPRKRCRRAAVPRGMVSSIVWSGVFGYLFLWPSKRSDPQHASTPSRVGTCFLAMEQRVPSAIRVSLRPDLFSQAPADWDGDPPRE